MAQTVAVATPCCPAPVSAMIRCLPMRWASRHWPRALLILWAPVWARSSRLRYMRAPPQCRLRFFGVVQSGRATGVVGHQIAELLGEPGVVLNGAVGILELGEGGHNRFRYELATEVAKTATVVRKVGLGGHNHVVSASGRYGGLPGVGRELSDFGVVFGAVGFPRRWTHRRPTGEPLPRPRRTLAGVKPPARRKRRPSTASWAAMRQSKDRPVPPCNPATWLSRVTVQPAAVKVSI